MRQALWSDSTAEEAEEVLGRAPAQYLVVVAEDPGGGLCGFAEAGLRDYAEGCASSPVAYLEGIWVDPEHRRSRVGAALVEWVESWARKLGLSEMASDCLLENAASLGFHLSTGFQEVERVICFRRRVSRPEGDG